MAIKTIARLYKWTIADINKLYMDDLNYEGLYYWYKDAQDYIEQINKTGIDI